MIPLVFSGIGEMSVIRKVGGTPEIRKHLEDMGFVAGSQVTVINRLGGNLIVRVKESRVALNEDLAKKIMV